MALQCLQAGAGMRIPVVSHWRSDGDIIRPLLLEQLLNQTPRWAEYQRRSVRLERVVLDCAPMVAYKSVCIVDELLQFGCF
jgi:hypothetical protein